MKRFEEALAGWRNAWERVTPFFAFPPAVRKVIDTTNAIESVNAQPRKSIKTRGHFPSDEAATKLIWLAPGNITKNGAAGPMTVFSNPSMSLEKRLSDGLESG